MVREFKLTGTALPHKEKVESLYLIKKKTMKKATAKKAKQKLSLKKNIRRNIYLTAVIVATR